MAEHDAKWGVLLLAHGAPDKLDDIPKFLLRVRNGRPLPPTAVEEIARRYAAIGGGSPLLRLTQRQAAALAARLGLPVYVGMRNWRPFIADAVKQMTVDAVERVVALCLAPHNSRTSIGLYRSRLDEAVKDTAPQLAVQFVENWHDQEEFIQALAEKLRATLNEVQATAGRDVPVILTAHSVPQATIGAGDPYEHQVRETAERVAAAAGCRLWHCAFQSQGMTAEPWLGPTVESVLDALANDGHREVVVAPIGFVSDHVEILYDIDIAFRNYARERGLALHRTESLNDSPLLIEALAAIVRARASS